MFDESKKGIVTTVMLAVVAANLIFAAIGLFSGPPAKEDIEAIARSLGYATPSQDKIRVDQPSRLDD